MANPFTVEVVPADEGLTLLVATDGPSKSYTLPRRDHDAWLDLHETLAGDFGSRIPLNRLPFRPPPSDVKLQPVLTEAVSPEILYGYGDPCVLYVAETRSWFLIATSNDAPQSFPILRSRDLKSWELVSFAFPQGAKPAWCLDGPGSDFWAPEIHRVGEAYWLVFSAREKDGRLAIGLATAASPEGPYHAHAAPLLRGGVIDPHLHVTEGAVPLLFWKVDDNGVWPRLLARRLHEDPELAGRLFETADDRTTAALAAAMWPWVATAPPMEQFFALQPLIEAAAENLPRFEAALATLGEADGPITEALKTRIFAQALSADGSALVGERHLVLQNDQPWEAHLIEGVWVTRADGRYYLFYAANDFSTPQYGIGVAVAQSPLGPYRKLPAPLLGSTAAWVGPGHPSVAPGLQGEPKLFLHAFFPGALGYKRFRAVLAADLVFSEDGVRLG